MLKKGIFHKKIIVIIMSIFVTLCLFFLLWKLWLENMIIFSDMEGKLKKAVERYYEANSKLLPSEAGKYHSISLDVLYEHKWLTETLFIPKTKKMCSEDSFGRVFYENGKYRYLIYLECGKYKSNIDHVGPEIELNGNEELILTLNAPYEELGVKSVKDNVDGNLDIKNVSISNNIDVTKPGTYHVTYSITDKNGNKGSKQRIVRVVWSLSNEALFKMGNDTRYYKGNANNYVWYSGFLWRIVSVDDNNLVNLISDENLTTLAYGNTPYSESDARVWLNDYFYPLLKDPENLLEKVSWCEQEGFNFDVFQMPFCDETEPMYVGMLTAYEYGQSFFDSDFTNSYLSQGPSYVFSTRNMKRSYAYRRESSGTYEYPIFSRDISMALEDDAISVIGIRPMINLKADAIVYGGDGSLENPYILTRENKNYINDDLNTRYSGEYVKFSGFLWRIIHSNEDGTTRLILNQLVTDDGIDQLNKFYDANAQTLFDVENKNNIGYYLNHEFIKRLNEDMMAEYDFNNSPYDLNQSYREIKGNYVKAKVGLMTIGELFTAQPNYTSVAMWTMTPYANSRAMLMIRDGFGYAIYGNLNHNVPFNITSVRPVINLKKDVKISGGNGTEKNPFTLK